MEKYIYIKLSKFQIKKKINIFQLSLSKVFKNHFVKLAILIFFNNFLFPYFNRSAIVVNLLIRKKNS